MRVGKCLYRGATVFALTATAPPALAGAFNQDSGRGQIIVTGTFTDASRFYDSAGRLVRGASYRKFEATAYVEYGLVDWLTLLAKPSLITTHVASPLAADYSGLGASEFGAQFRVLRAGPYSATLAATFRAPGGRDDGNPARHGDVTAGGEIRAAGGAGLTLFDRPAFVEAQVAYRFRAGAPPDEWHIDATFGLRPRPDVLVLLQTFSTISQGGGRAPYAPFHYHKLQASLVYDLTRDWSAQIGLFVTPAGGAAARELGGLVAVWRRF